MALINCPQCGHTISDKATQCPNCGCEIAPADNEQQPPYDPEDIEPQPKSNLKWLLIAIAVVLVGGAAGYYFYSEHKRQEEANLAAEQARLDSLALAQAEAARLDSIRQDSIKAIETIKANIITASDVLKPNPNQGDYVKSYSQIIKTLKQKGYELIDQNLNMLEYSDVWGDVIWSSWTYVLNKDNKISAAPSCTVTVYKDYFTFIEISFSSHMYIDRFIDDAAKRYNLDRSHLFDEYCELDVEFNKITIRHGAE